MTTTIIVLIYIIIAMFCIFKISMSDWDKEDKFASTIAIVFGAPLVFIYQFLFQFIIRKWN